MCDRSAEASGKGINHFKLPGPGEIFEYFAGIAVAQCVTQIGSDQSGGACLIPM
jgi:hypothetical protein